ncbi:hypothetical protein [Persephonella sp.]
MFVEIEENLFVNSDMVVAVELTKISSEPYGEIYRWAFYTTSSGEKSVFFSRDFDNKEEAINWFENIRFIINREN